MNIKLIFEEIKLFILLVIGFFFTGFAHAQSHEVGFPFIENITPKHNGFRDPNTSLALDSRGFLYIGNKNGVLEYDGSTWRKISMRGTPNICSTNKGQIYAAGLNTFGVLAPNKDGKVVYKPLVDSSNNKFGQVTSICSFGKSVYFSALNSLFQYSDGIKQLVEKQAVVKLFKLQNEVLVYTSDGGLQNIDEGKLIDNQYSQLLLGKKVDDIADHYLGYLLVSNNETYLMLKSGLKIFNSGLNDFLKQYDYSGSLRLKNGNYIFYTKKGGVVICDYEGNIQNILNKESGLYDNNINEALSDDANNIWLALNNGISRVEYPSAFSYFNYSNGLLGRVNSIIRHDNVLYFGTSSGTYMYHSTGKKNGLKCFKQVDDLTMSCTQFFEIGKKLFACTSSGIYEINGSTSKLHISGKFRKCFNSDLFPGEYYLIEDNSVLLYSYTDKWQYDKSIEVYNSEVTSIAEDMKYNIIWIGTKFNGVYSVHKSDIANETIRPTHYSSKHGFPKYSTQIDVYGTSKGVVFATSTSGLYEYNYVLNRFDKNKNFPDILSTKGTMVHPLVEDSDRNIWLNSSTGDKFDKQVAVAWNIAGVDKYTYISQPFNVISDFNCETIFPDTNFVVWFGGYDGVIRLDFKKLYEDSLSAKTYIREISFADSVFFHSTEFNSDLANSYTKLSYSKNNISFRFSTAIFKKSDYVLHQYMLEGYSNKWSDFTNRRTKEYTNLDPGKYVFRVRAKDVYNRTSDDAVFKFEILKPIYTTWYAYVLYVFLVVSIVVLIVRYRSYQFAKEKYKLEKIIASRTEELLREKEKTERLLANILPEKTVKELKDSGRAKSMRFNIVTVLFSDIQGFTRIAEEMNPDLLVDELDRFFLEFDKIVEKYNIEKIKTIGDAYMCAGGIPQKNRTNPLEVIIAALEIQEYVKRRKSEAGTYGKDGWGLRVGIHTGPVVAGVIGSKKYSYDIWGDSVNIASRMESSSEVDRINISEDTYLFVKKYFDCKYRGKMPVKYKGEIDMYFVNGLKPEYSMPNNPLVPNENFLTNLKRYRYEDLEEYVLDRMEVELPDNLYYHNVKHTIDVIVQTEIIARGEGVNDEELLLLKTAALLHDSGFMLGTVDHEVLGIQLAGELLPKYKYTEEQIVKIGDLIYATRMPHNPKNKLEQIMCDADLDYLGRPDYLAVSRNLYMEMVESQQIKKNEQEWNKLQVKFLESHRYYTETAKRRRNHNKNKELQKAIEINMQYNANKQS